MTNKAFRSRKPGNRGRGGRPRKEGERYENGRLKASNAPNATVLAIRDRFGLNNARQAFTPLGVAAAHRWLDERDIRTAHAFAALHHASKLEGPRIPSQSDLSNPEAVDVRAVTWAQLSDAEIVAIWESALRDVGPVSPDGGEEFAAEAWRRYKLACASMTPDERREVVRFCIDDSWPQWLLQRRAGHMGTAWERSRDLLVSGLRKIARASARPVVANDAPEPMPVRHAGGVVVERSVYVDGDDNPLFTVERVARRRAA